MPDKPTRLQKRFSDVLEGQLGKDFIIINPHSFEHTRMGFTLKEDHYPAKLVALGDDFVVMVLRFEHGHGDEAQAEPTEQYIPLMQIKRISLMRSNRYIHL